MRKVSAADANRHFAAVLREVRAGKVVTVTSRGVPVAVMSPAGPKPAAENQAKAALLARLRGQAPAGATWRRDDLYDDETGG